MRFRPGGAVGEGPGTAGQGLVEYALILVLVVIIATVALVFFGPQLAWALSLIGTQVDKAG
jgi:Flp pilus assembly pilin Flp